MPEPTIKSDAHRDPLANWNGALMPLSEVKVSVLDRAFLFGDAIYEVIRIYGGRPFLFEDHVARLGRNLEKLNLPADAEAIAGRTRETIAASDVVEGIVYIQVTRGVAPRTHQFPVPAPQPNELIYVADFKDPYVSVRQQGVSVIVVDDMRWKRCDIKSVNLLANCMAAQAACEAECAEALFVDGNGRLTEGSRSSLFGVRNGTILTAPLRENILPGITRKLLMQLAEECDFPMREEALHLDNLSEIDELFLTGTTTEILPITLVDQRKIGTGTSGPIATKLYDAYKKTVDQLATTTG